VNQWRRGPHTISDDRARLDLEIVHGFLTTSYWSPGVARDVVERAVANSLVLGVYRDTTDGATQVGFARVVTDRATFAYLADVFVLDAERGGGLGHWLVETALSHPELQGLRRWMLATADAHGLYAQHGFTPLDAPERFMERRPGPPRDAWGPAQGPNVGGGSSTATASRAR
jgi:GNAT superfamily N-acetyltransferase